MTQPNMGGTFVLQPYEVKALSLADEEPAACMEWPLADAETLLQQAQRVYDEGCRTDLSEVWGAQRAAAIARLHNSGIANCLIRRLAARVDLGGLGETVVSGAEKFLAGLH